MVEQREKIEFRCKTCNNRLFDYVSGNMHIEMKCTRCKRVMILKSYTEKIIRNEAIKGIFKI